MKNLGFGARLKEIRLQNDITREDLAAKVDSTPQSIWRYERGLKNPDIAVASRIAKVLQVPLSVLLGEARGVATRESVLSDITKLVKEGELTLEDVVRAALLSMKKRR